MAFDGSNGGSGNWLRSNNTLAHGIGTGDFTIAGWFRGIAPTGGYRFLWSNGNVGASVGLIFSAVPSGKFGVWSSGAQTFDTVLSDGTWYHLAATRSSGTLTGYVNGTAEATTPAPAALDMTTQYQWLASGEISNYKFNGIAAEVGLWSAALSASEVVALAKNRKPDSLRRASLKAYWPFVREIIDRGPSGDGLTTQNGGDTYYAHVPLLEDFLGSVPGLSVVTPAAPSSQFPGSTARAARSIHSLRVPSIHHPTR